MLETIQNSSGDRLELQSEFQVKIANVIFQGHVLMSAILGYDPVAEKYYYYISYYK